MDVKESNLISMKDVQDALFTIQMICQECDDCHQCLLYSRDRGQCGLADIDIHKINTIDALEEFKFFN